MKLRKRIAPILVPIFGPLLVRALGCTWRIRKVGDQTTGANNSVPQCLYCFWHGDLLVPLYAYRGSGVVALISSHRDGAMLRPIVEHFGFGAVVGTITRGGAMALRGLLSTARLGKSLCVPPDGPRGPRGVVKKGVIFLASRTQLAVVPAAAAASSAWRAGSWDRMLIPKPFARVVLYCGPRAVLPRDLDTNALEPLASRLQGAIERARETAEAILRNPTLAATAADVERLHARDREWHRT